MTKKTKQNAQTLRANGGYDEGYCVPTARCNADVIKQAVEIERHYRHKDEIEYIDEDVAVLNDEMDKMSAEGILEKATTTKGARRYHIKKQMDKEEENKTPNEWRKV